MIRTKAIAVLLITVFALGACKPQVASTALSAVVSELQGKVELKQAGLESFVPAAPNSILDVNGQIQTGDDGRARLDLSTGTIIRIAPSSLFTLVSNDKVEGGLATKVKLEVGKIFIILNGGSADVETPSGVASVRGSYLKVWVDPATNDVYATCLEGHCSAVNPAGSVDFTEGEKTILFHQNPSTGNWTVPGVEPMTPEDFQEWLDENPEARELFNQAMATLTAMAEASPEPTATPAVATLPPAEDPSKSCFNIIQPADGTSLPSSGKVTFEWKTQEGAQKYIMALSGPDGTFVTFETAGTSLTKYIEILTAEGQYSWDVTAYGEDGSEICKAKSTTFSKPYSKPEPTAKPTAESAPCDPNNPDGGCYIPPQ